MAPPEPRVVREGTFRFLAAYAVALTAAQTLSIAVSLAHVVMGQAVSLLILASSLAAAWRYAVWLKPAGPVARVRSSARLELGIAAGVMAVAGGVYVLSWIAAIAKPDLSWDGNSYHIPMMHLWARRGFIHWIQFDYDPGPEWNWLFHWLFNGYPKGAETIDFLLVRAAGSSLPANVNNLVYLPVGVAGVAVAGRALGASRLASWTAGAALGLVPTVVGQGMTSYVDASLGESMAALVGCLVVVLPIVRRGELPWKTIPALASTVGLTASAKSSGLAPALLAGGLLVLASAWAVVRSAPGTRRVLARRHLAFTGAVAAIAFAVTGYWYVRSWYYTGNPLSPVRVALLGHQIFPGVPLKDSISEDVLTPDFMAGWPGWKRVAFTWLQGGVHLGDLSHQSWLEWASTEHHWPRSMRWYDAHDGGLGYLWVLACLPAIAFAGLAAWRNREHDEAEAGPRLDVFVPMAFVVGVSFLVVPMNWWARYTVGLFALGLPCLAWVIDRVARAPWPGVRALLGVWLAGCFAIASFESLYQFRYSGLEGGFLAAPWKVTYTPAGLWHDLIWYEDPTYLYALSPLDVEVNSTNEPVALGSFEI
ncbi:MAG: hypothetical protein ACRELB_03755, partial [Polyangiaceae bacterium]